MLTAMKIKDRLNKCSEEEIEFIVELFIKNEKANQVIEGYVTKEKLTKFDSVLMMHKIQSDLNEQSFFHCLLTCTLIVDAELSYQMKIKEPFSNYVQSQLIDNLTKNNKIENAFDFLKKFHSTVDAKKHVAILKLLTEDLSDKKIKMIHAFNNLIKNFKTQELEGAKVLNLMQKNLDKPLQLVNKQKPSMDNDSHQLEQMKSQIKRRKYELAELNQELHMVTQDLKEKQKVLEAIEKEFLVQLMEAKVVNLQ